MVAVAVAVSSGDVGATAVVNGAWAIANAAVVELPDAVVHVVADAIRIRIGSTVATADAEGIQLVAITVAVSGGDVGASAVVDGARSIADPAVVVGADTVVDVVTEAVSVEVCRAVTATDAEGIVGQAGSIFICGIGIVIAGCIVRAPRNLVGVADAITIDV